MQRLPEGAGVNKIKSKRRDLQRLLNKPGLSAEKKREVERALQVLAGDLEQAVARNQTKKNAQKYHMVKFFERTKASRAIKKNAGPHQLADYYYIVKFPMQKKYVALFAEGSVARNSQLYKDLLQKAKDGKLEVPKTQKRQRENQKPSKNEPSSKAAKAVKESSSESESQSESQSESESENGSQSDSPSSSSSSPS